MEAMAWVAEASQCRGSGMASRQAIVQSRAARRSGREVRAGMGKPDMLDQYSLPE
jgi:hypothetical protein